MQEEVNEAPLERTESGLRPSGPGWFVLNLADAHWGATEGGGSWCDFEGARGSSARFSEFGINVHVLGPGEPNCMYHRENAQEAFLVLAGRCTLVVEGEERELVAGDFFHCPPGVRHVFVGRGPGPCAIVMVGTRKTHEEIEYPVERAALRHGAGVPIATPDPRVAYADRAPTRAVPSPWPLG